MLNRIKKKQDAVDAKAIAPNNKLYLCLLLGATALTGISLIVQECDAAFTIWTSIICGGIASIVVAWLIDAANCRQLNKKAVEHRKTLLSNLYHVFDNGLQLLILESAEKDHYTDSKKWYEWIETVDKQAMNDPSRGYILNPHFVELVCHYGKKSWANELSEYQVQNDSLKEMLARKRNLEKIPIKLPNGITLSLSAGEHNDLQKAIIEQFLPLFGFGAEVLYVGDTSNKYLHVEKEKLEQIHFFEIGHEELPDVVAYCSQKNLLYLVEAVHSHGPMDEIRIRKLKRLLTESGCTAQVVFFTAYLDKKTFRKDCEKIAWETEVWIAENPEHLIHFNGHKFLDLYK